MRRGVLLVLMLLSGCATWTAGPQGDLDMAQGAPHRSWTMMGRVAVSRPQGNDSGRLEWRLTGVKQYLELLSPLGTTVAFLTSTPLETHLILADRREFVSSDPATLTETVLGYSWPLKGLSWWLRGQPDPGEPAEIERDEQHHIDRLMQAGWVIHYADWRQVGEEWLPGTLTLMRDQVRLRIKVDRWVLGQDE